MRQYFELDLNRLDEEWVEQPRWFSEVAHKLAEARENHEIAKAVTETVWAELDLEVRSNPTLFGVEKITEALVKSVITVQQRYRDAVASEIKARRAVNDLEADRDTLEHRKKALEKAVDLRLAHYFSEPRPSPQAQQAHNEKQAIEGMKKKRKPEIMYAIRFEGELGEGYVNGPMPDVESLLDLFGEQGQIIVSINEIGEPVTAFKWDVKSQQWTTKQEKKKKR